MSRRSSICGTFGKPYQIFHEVLFTGKTVLSSKRRVTWRFGWSDSESVQEIVMIHSLVSGKKQLYEDNAEITSSTSVMATDFSHGWNSSSTLFRVEAKVDFTTNDIAYYFSIDGAGFITWPTSKPSSVNGGGGRYASEDLKSVSAQHQSQQQRQQRSLQQNNSFADPFASNGASSDPFGLPASASTFGNSAPGRPAAIDIFHSNQDTFDPFSSSGNTETFDPFSNIASAAPVPAPAPAPADPFSSNQPFDAFNTTNNNSALDPFAAQTTQAAPASQELFASKQDTFDPFGAPAPALDVFGGFGQQNNVQQPISKQDPFGDFFN